MSIALGEPTGISMEGGSRGTHDQKIPKMESTLKKSIPTLGKLAGSLGCRFSWDVLLVISCKYKILNPKSSDERFRV